MRPPPGDHWGDTLPQSDRDRYRAAWNSFTACRDCKHWLYDDEDGDGVGCCDVVHAGAFIVPEDYTCEDFKPKT